MSRHSKVIAALLSLIFLFSFCTLSVYAEDIPDQFPAEQGGELPGGDSQGGDSQGGDIQGGGDSQGGDSQGGGDIQGGGDSQGSGDGQGDDSQGAVITPGGDSQTSSGGDSGYSGGNSGYIGGDSGYSGGDSGYSGDSGYGGNSGGSSGGNSGGEVVYYDSDGNTYSDYSEMYVGGDQVYTPPATVAPSAALYDTSNTKVDEKTLSSNDWNDIKAALSGSKTSAGDGDDFAFIQNNASTGDNGHMIFIIGLAMLLLSALGFIYLIASAVSRRKKAPARSSSSSSSSGGRYRSDDDYNDGYSSSRSAKRSSRYDTADIPMVKTSKPQRSSKGGKRYR